MCALVLVIHFKIDKLTDEKARAGLEANIEGGQADGTFIIPAPGRRAVLRKTVSTTIRRTPPRFTPPSRGTRQSQSEPSDDGHLDGDLYTVNSDADSLDEIAELESW